jgi:hypothetical protein
LDNVDWSRFNEAKPLNFGGVLVLLMAFNNPNACYAVFRKHNDRCILLITSGSLGEEIVLRIIQDFQ